MLPHVEAGLNYWRECNKDAFTWASFDAIALPNNVIVVVRVGVTHYKGSEIERRDCASKTRTFLHNQDGVSYFDSPHP
jgi:hypothetical protein